MSGIFKSIKSQWEALTDVKRHEQSRSLAPLFDAIDRDDVDAVRLIVKNNPGFLNTYSLKGETALHRAVKNGSVKMTRALISAGADINLKVKAVGPYDSLIHLAVLSDNPDMIPLLNSIGISLTTKAKNMLTPLRQAINMNKPDMVKALIDAGADPFESMVKNGPPPLTSAMFENKRDALQGMLSFPEVQKTLSYEFANRHNKGVRPVFVSLEMGYLDTARQIFDMGLPVNCVDEKGNTPLHWAIYHKDADFVQYLVEKGADIKGVYNKSGLTPFHLLCTKAHEFKQDDLQRIFDLLTAYGGEILEETKSHKSLNKIIGSSKNERFKNSVKDYQSGFPKN